MNTTTVILCLVIVAALAVASVIFLRHAPTEPPDKLAVQQNDDFPPKPKWKPDITPVDINRTIKTFIYYTDNKRAFAIFYERHLCSVTR